MMPDASFFDAEYFDTHYCDYEAQNPTRKMEFYESLVVRVSGDQHPVDAEVVQAATKWKRMALGQFGMEAGEGLMTDMRAVRKDYFLDHDHSAYVDQWDWELAINEGQRNLNFLTEVVEKIWKVITGAEKHVHLFAPVATRLRHPVHHLS